MRKARAIKAEKAKRRIAEQRPVMELATKKLKAEGVTQTWLAALIGTSGPVLSQAMTGKYSLADKPFHALKVWAGMVAAGPDSADESAVLDLLAGLEREQGQLRDAINQANDHIAKIASAVIELQKRQSRAGVRPDPVAGAGTKAVAPWWRRMFTRQ